MTPLPPDPHPSRRSLGALPLAALVLLCVLFATARCSSTGTALFLRVTLPAGVEVHQLELRGSHEEASVFGPERRPEGDSASPLGPEETVRVLLPESLAGGELTVTVLGLRAGEAVAHGAGVTRPRAGEEVSLSLALVEGAPPDPGPGPADGGSCADDCAGCCGADGGCELGTSVTACGTSGAACTPCDPARSDTCVDGVCGCGGGEACAEGQVCVDGGCACTPESCAGCCDGTACRPGTEPERCGNAGQACVSCPGGVCGAGGICGDCNATTCPDGCCAGTCTPRTAQACGAPGGVCSSCGVRSDGCGADGGCQCGSTGAPCLGNKVDRCVGGSCRCGDQPPCGPGLRCANQQCICDVTSGCDGCCVIDQCLAGTSDSACGRKGEACQVCEGLLGCSSTGTCTL